MKSVIVETMCDSVMPMKPETFSGIVAKSPIGKCIQSVLLRANSEKRITVGLLPTIQYLSQNYCNALFCFIVEAPPGDSATHMQEVLLHAFCAENDIYLMKVDSSAKMKNILQGHVVADFNCVLVHFPFVDPFTDSQEVDLTVLSKCERDLVNHCETTWGNTPIVKLPEK